MNQVQPYRTFTYKTKASIVCLGKNLVKCAEMTRFPLLAAVAIWHFQWPLMLGFLLCCCDRHRADIKNIWQQWCRATDQGQKTPASHSCYDWTSVEVLLAVRNAEEGNEQTKKAIKTKQKLGVFVYSRKKILGTKPFFGGVGSRSSISF